VKNAMAMLERREFLEHRGRVHFIVPIVGVGVPKHKAMFALQSAPVGNIYHGGRILFEMVF
jgi:hypothetical protein